MAALACRRNGAWQIEAVGFTTGEGLGEGSQDRGFRPAGSASIDGAIDERIAGYAFDASSEAALIRDGWNEL